VDYLKKIKEAGETIRRIVREPLDVGIILGTGLGELGDKVQNPETLAYTDIPHFPEPTVKFHAGTLMSGTLANKSVLLMRGRYHVYEGHALQDIVLPVRVFHHLGIRSLILTNAAGGIREELTPGTLTVITDHINLMGVNPLIGPYDERLGTRFPDMSQPYDPELRRLAHQAARELNISLRDVIYSAVSGPSYETPAEIRMLQILGADSVGMSVIPEVLVARQLGMRVLAVSAITDQALPDAMVPVTHEQVSQTAKEMAPEFKALMLDILKRI